jgi:hypothetical protein
MKKSPPSGDAVALSGSSRSPNVLTGASVKRTIGLFNGMAENLGFFCFFFFSFFLFLFLTHFLLRLVS